MDINKKIEKLDALSRSGNINEAKVAFEKLQQLMEMYNISEIQNTNEDTQYEIEQEGIDIGYRVRDWKKIMAKEVANLFDCEMYQRSFGGAMKTKFMFIGDKNDRETAIDIYQWLEKTAIKLKEKAKKESEFKGEFFSSISYYSGFVDGLRLKIEKIKKDKKEAMEKYDKTGTAIQKIDEKNELVKQFMNSLNLRDLNTKKYVDKGYDNGKEDAQKLNLNQINGGKSSTGQKMLK
ncbi:MAG: DUF2786 domain-containing protein [Candidatus Woesearchaeota archaeon]